MDELFRTSERLCVSASSLIHNHDYCRFVKSLDANLSCAIHKHRTLRLARHGRCFRGCCPYGVWEYVQPVLCEGRLICVIYIGTFINRDHPGWRRHAADYSGAQLPPLTQERMEAMPAIATFLAQFLQAEFYLARSEAHQSGKQHDRDYYCRLVKNLISLRYREDLRLRDAAEACGLNANYLGNLLKDCLGKTFTQLLTEQRLLEATACLKYHKELSIGGVARACGFHDGNYFSLVFSRHTGMSPSEFRANWDDATRRFWTPQTQ